MESVRSAGRAPIPKPRPIHYGLQAERAFSSGARGQGDTRGTRRGHTRDTRGTQRGQPRAVAGTPRRLRRARCPLRAALPRLVRAGPVRDLPRAAAGPERGRGRERSGAGGPGRRNRGGARALRKRRKCGRGTRPGFTGPGFTPAPLHSGLDLPGLALPRPRFTPAPLYPRSALPSLDLPRGREGGGGGPGPLSAIRAPALGKLPLLPGAEQNPALIHPSSVPRFYISVLFTP